MQLSIYPRKENQPLATHVMNKNFTAASTLTFRPLGLHLTTKEQTFTRSVQHRLDRLGEKRHCFFFTLISIDAPSRRSLMPRLASLWLPTTAETHSAFASPIIYILDLFILDSHSATTQQNALCFVVCCNYCG